jgi:hypothetical protein
MFGVRDSECKHEPICFYALPSPVNRVAHVKQAQNVLELPVRVSTDGDLGLQLEQHWLIKIDLANLRAEPHNMDIREPS